MIEFVDSSIFEADVEALVNPVNCVGIMGAGLALQFKEAWPQNFEAYRDACRAGEVILGRIFTWRTNQADRLKFVLNFPTKIHWRDASKLHYIELGLDSLVCEINDLKIQSIAIPRLGCGYGGLEWSDVRPLIESVFESLSNVKVLLFDHSKRGSSYANV